MRARDSIRGDALAASLVFSSVLLELSIREAFHHTWAEVPKLLGVLALWLAMLLLTIRLERRRVTSSLPRGALRTPEWVRTGPLLLGIAIAIWVSVVCEPWLAEAFGANLGPGGRLVVSIIAISAISLLAHTKLSETEIGRAHV